MRYAFAIGPVIALVACARSAAPIVSPTGGDPIRGVALIRHYACGSCHTIPGVHGADGRVAPPLDFFSRRTYIAGEIANTPANLERWLLDPPSVEPGTAMPSVGMQRDEARDIAAYLLTLR